VVEDLLAGDDPGPVDAFRLVAPTTSLLARSNANARQHLQAIPADTPQDWAHFAAPRVFGLGVRMVSGSSSPSAAR
jgi:hypothetical protein